jgi:ABC-2 type transport system ATP-binding protein
MTTHYLDEADQLCDRIAVIDHGKIIAIGTPKELKDSVGGDTLELTVAPGSNDPTAILQRMPGVSSVTKDGDTYRVKCSNGESLIPKTVLAADQAGIVVAGVTVIKPTLDEVFLHMTGRAYREEGEAHGLSTEGDETGAAAPGASA